jgi:hypothetical protein
VGSHTYSRKHTKWEKINVPFKLIIYFYKHYEWITFQLEYRRTFQLVSTVVWLSAFVYQSICLHIWRANSGSRLRVVYVNRHFRAVPECVFCLPIWLVPWLQFPDW